MLKPLSHYLQDAIKRSGAKQSVTAAMIVEAATSIISQMVPELRPTDFRVQYYRNAILTIGAASPVVGQELTFRSESILEALKDTFPEQPLKNLRIVALAEDAEDFR